MRTLLAVLITVPITAAGVAVAQNPADMQPREELLLRESVWPLPPERTTIQHVKESFDCRAVVAVNQDKEIRVKRLRCLAR